MFVSGEDGETAADETEFGCAQGDSTISESETARGGVAGLEGETGGVMGEGEGEEGEVEDEPRMILLLFSWHSGSLSAAGGHGGVVVHGI